MNFPLHDWFYCGGKRKTKGAFGGEPRRRDILKRERKVARRMLNPAIAICRAENGILHRKDGQPFRRY